MSDIFEKMKESKTSGGPDRIERALFFVNGERCYLLHEVGCNIEADIEALGDGSRSGEAGPWTEIPKEDGLWIWEGTPGWTSGVNWEGINEGGEPIYEGRGKARRPLPDEVTLIINGPIEKLWGCPQLRNSFPGKCAKHMSGDDPFCDTCYPLVNPPPDTQESVSCGGLHHVGCGCPLDKDKP